MSHTKSAITLVVLSVMFVGAIVVGFQLATAPIPELELENVETSEPTCKDTTIEPGSELATEQVTVDVYNAGTVSGLASQTQRRLSRYGYQRGVTGNADDLDVRARNVTIVSETPRGPMARLLEQQFRGRVRVEKGKTEGETTSIAVVVGDKFVGLDRQAKSTVPVREKLEICVPIESNPTGS